MKDEGPDPTRDSSPNSPPTPHRQKPPTSEQTTRSVHGTSGEQERIGNYRILEQVGTGGMGEVYRAEQTEPIRRTVALKVIKRGMDTKEVISRFEAERQALALMDHPSIAKVFDAGSTPRGRPYFAMEYVKGIPITKYCDEHRLSMRARLELFTQLCEGVQHAHQKAIIHRDLKPSNVLVTTQDDKPVPKIIDFGVAKATAQKLTEKTMYTALGEMIGTPEYMSPEQAALTGEDIDTRTDVYALGVILYELLSGALPFDAKELRKAGFDGIVRMIREQDPPRPSTKAGTLGERGTTVARARRTLPGKLTNRLRGDLDWITMRALEKDRTRRYGSPAELAADIGRYLRNEPVLAGPPSTGYRARKFVQRHTLGVGVATAGVLVLVGFAVTMTVQANRIAHERDRADQEAQTSDRVSEFLVSVFNVSDPGEARGNSITAREVLDNGALRIQRELKDQPLLRAKLMDSMGRVYQNLGLYATSESLLVRALELRKEELGIEHPESIETLGHVGALYHAAQRLDEAKTAHEQALSLRERLLGPDHVDVAWSLYYLGANHVWRAELQTARRYLERALPIFESKLGPDHRAVARCLALFAVLFGMMEDNESALAYCERALEIKTRTLDPDHHEVGLSHGDVGYTLLLLDRLDEARPHVEQAYTIIAKSLGSDHDWTANQLHSLGELLRREGNHTAARDTLERALHILEKVHPDTWNTADILHSLALVAAAGGDEAVADSLFRRTMKTYQANRANAPPILAKLLGDYAAFLRASDRSGDANAMEEQARLIREKHEQEKDTQ